MFRYLYDKLKRFYKWFKRPKTTVYIFAALIILYLLGLLIPQKAFFQTTAHYETWLESVPLFFPLLDFIGFTDIYLSPPTLFFLALFFLNLLAVTIDRIPLLIRQAHIGRENMPSFNIGDLQRSGHVREIRTVSSDRLDVMGILGGYFKNKAWYVLEPEGEERILAVRNRFSVFGFLLFHLSFLLLLAGGLLMFYSRMSGYIALTEGEVFTGDLNQFRAINRKPRIMEKINIPAVSVEAVEMNYQDDRRSDLFITLKIGKGSGARREVVSINDPAREGNFTMLANNAGVTPLFVLRDAEGNKDIDGAWVRLDVLEGKVDSFAFQNSNTITYKAGFFPDYVIEEGYERSRSHEIRNPAFHILVEDKGEVIAEATIKKGQAMIFGPYMLIFQDLRSWGELLVIREVGPPFLVAGFAFGITGLIMRLVFYRREIRICANEGAVYLLGRSALNQIAFDERMEKIVGELRGLLIVNEDRLE